MLVRRGVAGCMFLFVLLSLVALAAVGGRDLLVLFAIAPAAAIWILASGLITGAAAFLVARRISKRAPSASSESQIDLAAELAADVDTLVAMLADTLALAREKPPKPGALEPVDLQALLTAMIGRDGRGRVTLTGTSSPVSALADRAALEGVFGTLFQNALVNASSVIVRMDHGTSAAIVHVDDNGPGVPRRERAHLFDKRYSTKAPSGRRGAHNAALVTARTVMRAQGGDLTVACSPEGGARFTVRLPLRAAEAVVLAVAS